MSKTNLKIINYLEVENKYELIQSLKKTSFGVQNESKLIKHFNLSKPNMIPQYYFLYNDNQLIGYFFLEKKGLKKDSWCSISNEDELPKKQALYLLDFEENIFRKFSLNNGIEQVQKIRKELDER